MNLVADLILHHFKDITRYWSKIADFGNTDKVRECGNVGMARDKLWSTSKSVWVVTTQVLMTFANPNPNNTITALTALHGSVSRILPVTTLTSLRPNLSAFYLPHLYST